MTKKHFNTIARLLQMHRARWEGSRDAICVLDDFTNDLALYFSTQNPRFDYDRFVTAANGDIPVWGDGKEQLIEAQSYGQ